MQKTAILYEASQAVLSTFDLDQVLARILGIVREHFRLNVGAVLILDPAKGELHARAAMGPCPVARYPVLPLGKGLTGIAAQSREVVYARDVRLDPRYIQNNPSTRSELVIPLVQRDQVVGVLDLESEQLDSFDGETIELLSIFATQASIAIQNARLYTLEQRRATQMEAVNAIARQATVMVDLDQLLDNLCEVVLHSFPVDQVSVALCSESTLVVRRRLGRLTPCFDEMRELPLTAGLCGRALASGRAVVENDVAVAPGYISGYLEAVSEMVLPLSSYGEMLGVMVLDSVRRGAFERSDVQALEPVADICATAIQNAQHFQRARQLANSDGLTGIYNRRYFEQRIHEEIERSLRYAGSLSVLMVDIDLFKQLNDEFGHLAGDDVLRQVAQLFTEQLRKIDVVCRYGGEEFALIVPETSGSSALQVAEKLRRTVEQYSFAGVPRTVTISVGLAELPTHGHSRDELVRAADAALYAAKAQGRNRVVQASMQLAEF